MNKLHLFLLIIFICACNNSKSNLSDNKAEAVAQKMNGIYLFIKSKPVSPYKYLGSIELNWFDLLGKLDQQNLESIRHSISGIINYSDNLLNTINIVKEKYPIAEGIIFDDNLNRCEVIIFK